MKNQQFGNMAAKVEMVHIIHNALVHVIDPGGVIYYMNLEALESNSNLLFLGGGSNLLHKIQIA